ncbi:MAG: Gx transporter family protein [Coriobacteriia bacterium]|nr:Gx transporter family protein [Coriobacteriia bacterium]
MEQQRIVRIRRLAQVALMSALALVLSYLETMIPLPFAVPGIKLGLANIAVLIALCLCDVRSATLVMLIKVLASGFLFGSPLMLAYSAGGTLLAFAGMLVCRAIPWIDLVPTSMVAAILHNTGQLAVAAFFLSTTAVFLTLPVLAFAACITGFLTGLVAQGVVAAVPTPTARPYRFEGEELAVEPGKITAVVGRNGSGKTTLALKIAGLLPLGGEPSNAANPNSAICPCGAASPCDAADSRIAGFTGIAFQNPDNQIVSSIVEDDCAFGLENRDVPRSEMRAIVGETLSGLDLSELANRPVAELSGGEKQQVATAGLIAMSPATLVFDESAAMLSPCARKRFMAHCRRLASEGKAVVLITHSMDDAFACDSLALVSKGRIVLQEAPHKLVQNSQAGATFANEGLELPFALEFAQKLKNSGLPVRPSASEEDLCAQLAGLLASKEVAQ